MHLSRPHLLHRWDLSFAPLWCLLQQLAPYLAAVQRGCRNCPPRFLTANRLTAHLGRQATLRRADRLGLVHSSQER